MRLWTWQKEGFDIADGETTVRSLEHSVYVNNLCVAKSERDHFKRQYTELFKIVGTNQFHWYYTDEDDAKSESSRVEYSASKCVLWEVAVPGERVFQRVCDIAWNYLLGRPVVPTRLRDDWHRMAIDNDDMELEKKWKQDFSTCWGEKSSDELWKLLFLEKIVQGCTTVLLRHPLEDTWIERNPIKEGTWWKITAKARGAALYDCSLPCGNCPGRG